ncbi:hypothetical protein Sros01_37770 [Streptomyces roseochromogenus]|nr:hypothetical protein Sros01_37770 [Streptomyces roseochromogenus]
MVTVVMLVAGAAPAGAVVAARLPSSSPSVHVMRAIKRFTEASLGSKLLGGKGLWWCDASVYEQVYEQVGFRAGGVAGACVKPMTQ